MSDPYADYEIMSAPNRYRKLIPSIGGIEASSALACFFGLGLDQSTRDAIAQKMRDDWPDKADRVIGMEPAIDMCDAILIWEKPCP